MESIKDKMVNIMTKSVNGNKIICNIDYDKIYLPFRKFQIDFKDDNVYNQFISSVEKEVRNSKIYKAYLSYLINDVGIDWCSYFGNIRADFASIEFHHGPIFNLYDYCNIVTRKMLESKECSGITTFDVSDEVLRLHHRNMISLVPLSKSVHKTAHNYKYSKKNIVKSPQFIDIRTSFGDFFKFVKEYNESLTSYEINKIFSYFKDFERHVVRNENSENYFDNFIQIFDNGKKA